MNNGMEKTMPTTIFSIKKTAHGGRYLGVGGVLFIKKKGPKSHHFGCSYKQII
ncbi:hypothetical protein Hanom_Chr10g00876391 [Helianthus anomalus]